MPVKASATKQDKTLGHCTHWFVYVKVEQ
jgi:hypothetical protein